MLERSRCSSYSVSTPSRPGSRSYWATTPAPPPPPRRCESWPSEMSSCSMSGAGSSPPPARAGLAERDEQLLDVGRGVVPPAPLHGEDPAVERDGLEEHVEDGLR